MPELRIPIGFLPVVLKTRWGRFTAPDPARDLRGDGDLYDYCVDDPVSKVDPWGLFSYTLLDIAPPLARQAAELRKREAELEKSRRQATENEIQALFNLGRSALSQVSSVPVTPLNLAETLYGRFSGGAIENNINLAALIAKLGAKACGRPQSDLDKLDKGVRQMMELPGITWDKTKQAFGLFWDEVSGGSVR